MNYNVMFHLSENLEGRLGLERRLSGVGVEGEIEEEPRKQEGH